MINKPLSTNFDWGIDMTTLSELGLLGDLEMLYLREVATLERELDLYPDDKDVWKELPGLLNSAGTLFLHFPALLTTSHPSRQ
jgi:hypothetical protein